MQSHRIAELLQPFLSAPLTDLQLENISTYIDILLRWNARINLTAVRQPEEIVTRHFGESSFAARRLCSAPLVDSQPHVDDQRRTANNRVIDVGSRAGCPGIPIRRWEHALSPPRTDS